MLRKVSHIIFIVLLFSLTTGMTVSKHYCGGKLISVSLNHQKDDCCDMGGCCENETQVYQVTDDYFTPAVASLPVLAQIDILAVNPVVQISAAEEVEIYLPHQLLPVPVQKALSLRQVFLL